MISAKQLKKKARKAFVMLRSRPLLRDPTALGIPRIIWKTKLRGRRIIWKSSAEKREIEARKILPEIVPKENESFYFRLSKRYPYKKDAKRWEQYYDLPSMEDVFRGRMNRRMKKLLKDKNISLEELVEKCIKAEEELHRILWVYRDKIELDLGPDQLMVNVKKGKPELILVDV